jgi:hypothetical protein
MPLLIILLLLLTSCGTQEKPVSYVPEETPTTTNKTPPPVNDTPKTVPSPSPVPKPESEPKTSSSDTPKQETPAPIPTPSVQAPKPEDPKQDMSPIPVDAPKETPTAKPSAPVPTVPEAPLPAIPNKSLAEVEIEKLSKVVFNDQFYEVIEDGYRTGVAMGECPDTRCIALVWSGWSPGVGYSNISGYITSTPEKAKLWRNTSTFSDGSILDLHIITYKGKVLGVEGYISGEAKLLINVEYDGKYYRRYIMLPIGLSMDPMCTNSLTHPGWVGFGKCG